MRTHLTHSPTEAVEFIKRGGIVAFPTETVYGLGANVFDEDSVRKIFEAKRRPTDNPLIAHIGALEQIELLSSDITQNARKLIDAFFPGPLTVVLKKTERVPLIATAGLDTVGIRMPRHQLAREFLKACGTPVVAPSANLSGRPSPTTWQAVFEDLNGRIDCILQGDATEIGLESTVVDCTRVSPVILRTGAISQADLLGVVPEVVERDADTLDVVRSPGIRHRHYSPKAKVVLVHESETFEPSSSAAFIGLNRPDRSFQLIKICNSLDDYAHSLFEFLRECDRNGIEYIFCETMHSEGIGTALMDRLQRAAER